MCRTIMYKVKVGDTWKTIAKKNFRGTNDSDVPWLTIQLAATEANGNKPIKLKDKADQWIALAFSQPTTPYVTNTDKTQIYTDKTQIYTV